jgi:carbamoylphosphate synthase small subunit
MEDGSEFMGYHFGAEGTQLAEVVFNTSLTGYQEILTDPSYKGQFVTFTHPHIGNTGINYGAPSPPVHHPPSPCLLSSPVHELTQHPTASVHVDEGVLLPLPSLSFASSMRFLLMGCRSVLLSEDMESDTVHLSGIVIRDNALVISNYRSQTSLDAYLKEKGVTGIAGVDTREITRRLRNTGCLNGVITTDLTTPAADLVAKTKEWTIVGKDLISEVTCKESYQWTEATDAQWETGLVFQAKPSRAKGGEGEKFKACPPLSALL